MFAATIIFRRLSNESAGLGSLELNNLLTPWPTMEALLLLCGLTIFLTSSIQPRLLFFIRLFHLPLLLISAHLSAPDSILVFYWINSVDFSKLLVLDKPRE